MTTDELIQGAGGNFAKYLEKERLDLNDGEYRCISFNSRQIRSGKMKGEKMADAIFTNADKELFGVTIFPSLIDKATVPCVTGAKVKATFNEGRNGGLVLKEIK